MSRRSRAREIALQAIYQYDVHPTADVAAIERFLVGRLRLPGLVAFAAQLVDGVRAHRAALDARLDARSQNWRVARMAAIDRAILRLALYEMLHTETPGAVAVDEAIGLAKRYGSEPSSRFVAGILGALLADENACGPA
jgi:N utilization substance protein B